MISLCFLSFFNCFFAITIEPWNFGTVFKESRVLGTVVPAVCMRRSVNWPVGSYADITASSVGVESQSTEGKPVRLFNIPPVRRGVFFNSATDLLQDSGHFRPHILMYFPLVV